MIKHLYRFHDVATSLGTQVYLETYDILRHTPQGAWIKVHGVEKFVRLTARKCYACPTLEEAKKSFLARKASQIKICSSQLRRAQQALDLVSKTTNLADIPSWISTLESFL